MWIISKYSGLVNADRVIRFSENHNGTYAYCQGAAYLLTDKPAMATIIEALKKHSDFLEVE